MIDTTHQGPFRTLMPLVLGSASPRRQQLLTSLGIHFAVLPSSLVEPAPEPDETPEAYAVRMACHKADDVARQRPDAVILACDTIVVVEGAVLGKPDNQDHALDMLRRLNGREHQVISGCCLLSPQGGRRSFPVATTVFFADFADNILAAYARTGEVLDKAGGYAIQGAGAFLVDRVRGSVTNVIGLPLRQALGCLLELGAVGVEPGETATGRRA